jgi:hypothetical protein
VREWCVEISSKGEQSDDSSCIDPAREPQHVAEVLAELMNGKCFPFGPLEGAFMATSGDAQATSSVSAVSTPSMSRALKRA